MPVSRRTTWRGVVRSKRERPEPSTIFGAMSNCLRVSRTTAPPPAVEPSPPNCAPRPLSSISAMKLSDGWFIWRAIEAIGGDSHSDSGVIPVGASPERALPMIFTPRRSSAFSNAWAAKRAGLAWKYGRGLPVRPWL